MIEDGEACFCLVCVPVCIALPRQAVETVIRFDKKHSCVVIQASYVSNDKVVHNKGAERLRTR